jgi:hypothetical protein
MARPVGSGQDLVKRSVQFPRNIDTLLTRTAGKLGLNKTSALIVAVRKLAEAEGITEEKETAV